MDPDPLTEILITGSTICTNIIQNILYIIDHIRYIQLNKNKTFENEINKLLQDFSALRDVIQIIYAKFVNLIPANNQAYQELKRISFFKYSFEHSVLCQNVCAILCVKFVELYRKYDGWKEDWIINSWNYRTNCINLSFFNLSYLFYILQ